MYNRFHRGEWITWASGGEGALDTPESWALKWQRCQKWLEHLAVNTNGATSLGSISASSHTRESGWGGGGAANEAMLIFV